MSKHETTFTPDGIKPELLRRTEAAVLAFMAKNDGRMPTQQQVNQTVCTSFTRLGPAMSVVKARLFATQTKLANMPEIPDDLRLAHEQMLKEMWARTRELQNGEIVDLRRAQAAKDDSNRNDLTEARDIIALVEKERDGEVARAQTAEAENAELRDRLKTALAEVAAAGARLAERDEIFAMLASRSDGPEAADGDPKAAKIARRGRKPDVPETGDLPMASSTAAASPSADT